MSEPIVFFGSGPVAAESLRLLADDFNIESVITKPRAPHHRGDVPVHAVANELGLPILTVSNKAELDDLLHTTPLQSRIGILIDFGIIVSQTAIDSFPLGIINSHFSILPEWRGADPITFAILSGQRQTGVSLMQLVAGLDEGPLLAYGEYDMPAAITNPQLTNYLIKLSHALLRDNLPKYLLGEIKLAPQSITGREPSYSRKLTKDDGVIDWQKPAAAIEREIRAYISWPRSRTVLGDHEVIVTGAHITSVSPAEAPGTLWIAPKQLGVYAGQDVLVIDRLLPLGKKEMTATEFMAGYQLK